MRSETVPHSGRRPRRSGHLLLAVPLLLPAGAASEPPSAVKTIPPVRATVAVTVLDLDVVATSEGRSVNDLRRDEIVVRVGGRVLPIDLFARVAGGRVASAEPTAPAVLSPAASLPEPGAAVSRQLLVYLDDARLVPWQRAGVIDGVAKLFERLGPTDEVSLVSYNGSTNVLVPFTGDRARLAEGLVRLRAVAPRGLVRAQQFRNAAAAMESEARMQRTWSSPRGRPADLRDSSFRAWAEEERARVRAGLEELRRTVSALAGRPGKRRMILVTTGWERIPGQTLAQIAFGRESLRQFDSTTWKETDAVLRAANRSGVTIDVVDAKGFESEVDVELAQKREVGPWVARLNERDGMATIAESTGGTFIESVNFYDRSLAAIWEESSDYYSIGVTLPEALPEGKVARVDLSCSRPGVKLRARTSVGARSDAEMARDLAESALLSPSSASAFVVGLELGAPRAEGAFSRRRVTPWRLSIPGRELTFAPDGDLRSAVVEVTLAAVDETGGRSSLEPRRHTISVPAARLDEVGSRDAPIEGLLRTRPGRHRVVATVRDVASGRTAVATAALVDE